MENYKDQQTKQFINALTAKVKPSPIPIYLTGLLFACEFKIVWIIITLSVLIGLSAFISLNKIYKFIQMKKK